MSRLLLVTHDYPPRPGGVARYYAGLAHALGAACLVLTDVGGAPDAQTVRQSLSWQVWPRWLPLLWRVPRAARGHASTHVAAGELLPTGTTLAMWRFAGGLPYLVFVHGFDVALTQRTPWKRWLARTVLQHAHLVVANSEFTKRLVLAAGALPERTVVVHPALTPLPPPGDTAALRRRHHLGQGPVLLSVARLVRRKGISDVIAVLPEVVARYPDARYVVVGGGPELPRLEHLAASLRAPVVFAGQVGDGELATWYELCDVFVLTPRASTLDVEGFGIVYLEAMAHAKPVVASRVGGVAEAVGEAGVLVSTPRELTAALVELIGDRARRERLGQLGRELVGQFTAERQAAILGEHLYAG